MAAMPPPTGSQSPGVGLQVPTLPQALEEVIVTFFPGPIGIRADAHARTVELVEAGGQAEREGVKPGWRIAAVGNAECESFHEKLFQDAVAGDKPYKVTLLKPKASQGSGMEALYEYSQKLGHRVTTLETELSRVRAERDNLKAENEAIGEHIFGLQQENGMLHDMGWTSYLEKAQLAKAAEGVSTDAAHLKSAVKEQKERIEYLTAENKKLGNTIDSMNTDRGQLQHTIRGLEVTLETVKADLQKRISRENALKERGTNLERCLEDVTNDKTRLDDVVSLQHVELAKLQQVTGELHAERARCHGITQKLKTTEAQMAAMVQEKAQLDGMVGTLHVEVAQLVTQRDSALTEVPQLQGTLRKQSNAVAELQEQARQAQNANHELQRRNVGLDAQVKKLFGELEEAKKEVARLERSSAMLLQERTQLRRALDEVSAQKGDVDQRLNSMMTQKGIVHAHFEQANGENNQLQMRIQQANSENASLRSRVAGLEKIVQGYEAGNAELHQRLQVLRNEKEEMQEHLNHLQPQRFEGRGFGDPL